MKRKLLSIAAAVTISAAALGGTTAASANNLGNEVAVNQGVGVQLANYYGYYRYVPRRFVRVQLRRRGYYRIHNIRLIRRYYRGYRYNTGYYGYYRPRVRAMYVAIAWKFGRKYRVFVNAYNGRPFRRVPIW